LETGHTLAVIITIYNSIEFWDRLSYYILIGVQPISFNLMISQVVLR
jgi:hypothetical protein